MGDSVARLSKTFVAMRAFEWFFFRMRPLVTDQDLAVDKRFWTILALEPSKKKNKSLLVESCTVQNFVKYSIR